MSMTTYLIRGEAAFFNRLDLGARFGSLRARYARYRLYRRTLNELSALGDRDLADLGLHRSMLRRAAYQAAYEAN